MGGGAQSQPKERTLVAHEFEASAHGWLVSGDTGAFEPQLHASGGDPGGYLSHADEALGETWYFRAPDSVLAALSSAERGTLSYSLKQSAEQPGVLDDDIVIVGRAGRLSFRFPTSPGTGWTPFSVKLEAGAGWRWNWNAPASQEQIRSVLAHPTSLEIRGEYHTGPDEGALDTVVLTAGAWLARDLLPGLLDFIARATNDTFSLHVAIYEMGWPAVLEALRAAHLRGANVKVVYHANDDDTGAKNEQQIDAAQIRGLCAPRVNAKLMHNKFLVLSRRVARG